MARRAGTLAENVVDACLRLADEQGWGRVRLHDVADALDVSLAEVRACYPDLDAVADAWLGRADDAMLRAGERADIAGLPPADRLYELIVAWLAVLGPRRRVLRDVLRYKLTPAHVHLQAALVVATSRRVQWLREAARFDAVGMRRSVEESGLTALFVGTVLRWLSDDSEGFERTRATLRRRLDRADRTMARLFRTGAGEKAPTGK